MDSSRVSGSSAAPAPSKSRAEILAALVEPEAGQATPSTYLASLSTVALVVVLLPVIYFGFVAGTCWLWWWYLARGDELVGGFGGRVYGLLRIGPLVVGAVIVFFLFKPLL